jgi:hypothetical protein
MTSLSLGELVTLVEIVANGESKVGAYRSSHSNRGQQDFGATGWVVKQ